MPELPEVETVVRGLRKTIVGKKIKSAESDTPQLFESKSVFKSINKLLAGDTITAVDRRGKYILIHLLSYRTLVVHLKMTGHFLLENQKSNIKNQSYIRFKINFTEGSRLLFSDVRKFGRIWIVPRPRLESFFEGRSLAHDALSAKCTEEYLRTQLSRDRAIKALLLDQSRVAGIGNIYSDEILWAAKIHPLRKGNSLTEAEVGRTFHAMKDILKLGIKAGGTSIRDFRKPSGQRGSFQNHRKVYQRAGLPCPRCRTPIKRIVVTQRGTHFCPKCQR